MDPASTHRQDDFDMAKLQKSLKQQQRRSSTVRNGQVAKLSPAEIRSLNHSVVASKTGSLRSVDARSLHRLSSSTPPETPDDQASSNTRSERRSSPNLPTPPSSPQHERRNSTASARKLYAPQPVAPHVTAASLNGHSRPSSVNSYRGIATYRGPEITRTNSLTMIQHPSQQIVSNPLSNFSRPRQSTLTSSPDKPRSDQLPVETLISPMSQDERNSFLTAENTHQSRSQSPVRYNDSPVSLEEQDTQAAESSDLSKDISSSPTGEVKDKETLAPKSLEDDIPEEASVKQKVGGRKSFTGAPEPDQDQVKLRKEYKRRSFGFHRNDCIYAIQYADTRPGPPPKLRNSLKTELPSAQTTASGGVAKPRNSSDSEFGQHPAVRPLSELEASTEDSEVADKGKALETASDTSSVRSYPSYSRCSCCGRIQKPGGFMSELSPVLENENLRTNFSFEAGRNSPGAHRKSTSWSSENNRRYTPIIPMEVGDEVRQAAIAPLPETLMLNMAMRRPQGVAVNKPGDIIGPSSTPLAIMPRAKIEPRMVRFASLHSKGDDSRRSKSPPRTQQEEQVAQPVTVRRFGSLHGSSANTIDQEVSNVADHGTDVAIDYEQSLISEVHNTTDSTGNAIIHPRHIAAMDSTYAANFGDSAIMTEHEKGTTESTLPTTERNLVKEEDIEAEDMMVDLSSFDGTYVQGSLSRSATMYANPESPPGPLASSAPAARWPPPEPEQYAEQFRTKQDAALVEDGTNSQDEPLQPYIHESDPSKPSPTIVRILPYTSSHSFSSSMQSSPASSIYRNKTEGGPLMLGDWVLPESPSSHGHSGSAASSIQEQKPAPLRPLERRISAYEAQRNKALGVAGQVVYTSSDPAVEVKIPGKNAGGRGRIPPAVAAA